MPNFKVPSGRGITWEELTTTQLTPSQEAYLEDVRINEGIETADHERATLVAEKLGRYKNTGDTMENNNPLDTGGRAWGMDTEREDVQREVFIHMIMQNTGMSRDEAEDYIKEKGMSYIMQSLKGGKEIGELEKQFEGAKNWSEQRNVPFDPDTY